ncbi:hypothetical protein [Chitinophaga sp.]|uniref:hypothetical protein n=1 Tax=Chitinophaga sp. TaxID=1869181 RepID=UPI0031D70654
MTPLLYSISTVCLLKHYNQDYLLHATRTDFTGSNGVGKSIIADLFQIVFVADSKYIKFATEGIDKKGRKIEKLPYESGVGYVCFNVEVTKGNFIAIGAAILTQGLHLVKPFIITASIDLADGKLDQHTFIAEKLLFSNDFLRPNREAYTLDELARNLPEKHNLYIHYFSTREERGAYYSWLYHNELLPINLVKESNLKAFAKVIQAFSKSKSLDIDSSKSLIEYLFEEDEIEINQEYSHQDQTIRRLLHQFKATKDQIVDISNKQDDLRKLKKYNEEKKDAEHKLDYTSCLIASHNRFKTQKEFIKLDIEIKNKQDRLKFLCDRSDKFTRLVASANITAQKEYDTFTDLMGMQSLFDSLEELKEEERVLNSIETEGLMHEPPFDGVTGLMEKDARYYEENINKSKSVLQRYATIIGMNRKKKEQDDWLRSRIRDLENKELKLASFREALQQAAKNNLFVQALSLNKTLSQAQQAVLVHLRTVALSKPEAALEGTRYTESANLIQDLDITEDKDNRGWWFKAGPLNEFVPVSSMLMPDSSRMEFSSITQLEEYLNDQDKDLQKQKDIYSNLDNGKIPKEAFDYDFDIDLSDPTKIRGHRHAAQLCAVVNYKIVDLRVRQRKEMEKIENAKRQYGIAMEGVEYQILLEKIKIRAKFAKNRYESLSKQFNGEQSELNSIDGNLPLLKKNHEESLATLKDAETELTKQHKLYQIKYPENQLPDDPGDASLFQEIKSLQSAYDDANGNYISEYSQMTGKYEETKDRRDIRVNEQISNKNFSFEVLEQALLGSKIRTLDEITSHLEVLNTELLAITDDLLGSLIKVFGKTESYFDKYKELVQSLNDFFRGKLISNRFFFRIDFNPAPKLDIRWIEQLRKSAHSIADTGINWEMNPQQFVENFYMNFSGNKSRVTIEDLLNPKRYFMLRSKLTDEKGKDIPGSTGESYTAIALLGIARLSVVQDGSRSGLRFIILEESATLDSVNFGMFPILAKEYGYQIITMTPKPYAIGDDEGWIIHQLIPGKENKDINYPKVMSYFRTNKFRMELDNYLKSRIQ